MAREIHIHFPWGRLLGAVATAESAVLQNLKRIAARPARLEIILHLDPTRDAAEMKRLGIPSFTDEYVKNELVLKYESVGFFALKCSPEEPCISSWAKRLQRRDEIKLCFEIP